MIIGSNNILNLLLFQWTCTVDSNHLLKLDAFIVTPMQIITRYNLFFDRLRAKTGNIREINPITSYVRPYLVWIYKIYTILDSECERLASFIQRRGEHYDQKGKVKLFARSDIQSNTI